MPRIHLTRLTITATTIDINQHVNNIAYVQWMQDGATAHSAAQGWTLERYRELGAGWVVRSHGIEYLRQTFAGDTLLLYTWVAGLTNCSSPRRYLFLRESDQAPVAKAETLWVFVDFTTGRPAQIPPEVVTAYPVVADDDPELVALTRRQPRGRVRAG